MTYSINPNLVKARKTALLLVLKDKLPLSVVARKCGVNRTTVWRWLKKWRELNKNVTQKHVNRPNRKTSFVPNYYRWTIITKSSRPYSFPRQLPAEVVKRVLWLKAELKRCAEVIHHYLKLECIRISLSSVRRIFRCHHLLDRKKNEQRPYRRNLKRPGVAKSGSLVETDTVHLMNPVTGGRLYIYTVIDLYTRLAYARVYERIYQHPTIETILLAQQQLGFKFETVQADNGMEFGQLFKQTLENKGIKVRHTRVRRPNDNAHIERFNRTLRQECIGNYSAKTIQQIQTDLDKYLDYYNNTRVHLGIQCKTPQEMLQRS
jgi:transposase InsO family protein